LEARRGKADAGPRRREAYQRVVQVNGSGLTPRPQVPTGRPQGRSNWYAGWRMGITERSQSAVGRFCPFGCIGSLGAMRNAANS